MILVQGESEVCRIASAELSFTVVRYLIQVGRTAIPYLTADTCFAPGTLQKYEMRNEKQDLVRPVVLYVGKGVFSLVLTGARRSDMVRCFKEISNSVTIRFFKEIRAALGSTLSELVNE